MEFLVFIIFGFVVSEWFFGRESKHASNNNETFTRGSSYYRISGVLNMLVGFAGLLLFNYFLRGKDIIPVWSFWVGFVGFCLLVCLGMFHMYKMLTVMEP